MIAFLNQISSEAKIKRQLRQMLFGKNFHCPRCGSRKVYASEDRFRCRKCRRPFNLLTGTWLAGSKLSLRTLYALLWCSGRNGFPSCRARRSAISGKKPSTTGFGSFECICPIFSLFWPARCRWTKLTSKTCHY